MAPPSSPRFGSALGIELEIVDRETEAHLAAAGVGDLADKEARSTVMFDIGGGSSEIIWLDFRSPRAAGPKPGQGLGIACGSGWSRWPSGSAAST